MRIKDIKKIIVLALFTLMAMPMLASAQGDCVYACNDLSTYNTDALFCESFGGTADPFSIDGTPGCAGLTSSCGMYEKVVCCCDSMLSNPAYMQTPPEFKIPVMQVKIDTVKLSEVKCDNNQDGSYYCEVPWIGEYVVGVYDYALSIAGILAAVVLMVGGLMWIISGGDASKITQAKEMITGAVVGLLILAVSYLLLNRLNPDLTKFEPILIGYIGTTFMEDSSDSEVNNTGHSCPQEDNLINLTTLGISSSAGDPRLTRETIQGLKKAISEADKLGVKLHITSAFRSYATQEGLWEEALKTYKTEGKARKYVAKPNPNKCSGHLAGTTIDLCIKGSGSCSRIGFKPPENASYSDGDVVRLQAIMKKAGWKRYCNEWWHYQYNDTPGLSCSP